MTQLTLRQAPIAPLARQAWQRVEAALFARLDDGVVVPLYLARARASAAPRSRRRGTRAPRG